MISQFEECVMETLAHVLMEHCKGLSMPGGGRWGRLPARNGLAAWQQLAVVSYIEKHIGESITIRTLAGYVYLSSYCFRGAFKRSFGMPPHRYLVQQRIERAKVLLARSAWSVTEIAFALGFSRTSSFSAAFRQVTGTTPSGYRGARRHTPGLA